MQRTLRRYPARVRRFVLCCVVTSVTLIGAAGAGAARMPALDSRCDALREVVPATIAVVTGDTSGAKRRAQLLRDLSARELIPAGAKPALRKLARFFESVADMSLLERAEALGALSRPISKVVVLTARLCSAPDASATTSTTHRLR